MAEKKKPRRGGSDSAREKGLTGVVIHLTPEQRRQVGAAAALAGQTVKAFCASAALEASDMVLKKEQNRLD